MSSVQISIYWLIAHVTCSQSSHPSILGVCGVFDGIVLVPSGLGLDHQLGGNVALDRDLLGALDRVSADKE